MPNLWRHLPKDPCRSIQTSRLGSGQGSLFEAAVMLVNHGDAEESLGQEYDEQDPVRYKSSGCKLFT